MKKISLLFELTQKQYWWGIAIILLITAALRLYQLGQVPHGMTWDEAAIGYNGFAILTTRRDEWLTRLPVSFWSFGDYKAPLAIYLNGFFTYLFGMNLFAVRLPFAIAGIAAVLGTIYLTRMLLEYSNEKLPSARWLSLAAGGLMALSPWHHHFSRIGFESGMALMFFIWGVYFFHKALIVNEEWRQYLDFLLSIGAFVASVYTYHSAKITVPLIVLVLAVWQRKKLFSHRKSFGLAVIAGLIALRPLIYDSLFGKGLERAGTLILSQGHSFFETVQIFLVQLGRHLALPFLLQGETTTLRHGDGQWGVLLLTSFILIVISLIFCWRKKLPRSYLFWFGLIIALFGLLPAALAEEVPHSNRALLALPGLLLLAVSGLQALKESSLSVATRQSIIGMLMLLHGLFFISYLHNYYTHFAAQSAPDFQDGYLEAFQFALPYERGEGGQKAVDKIIFTSDYGQPYIYALFIRKTNPIWYQGGSLIKYEFKDEVTVGDLERENTLVVASNTDDLLGKNDQADHIIYGSDGLARFRIYISQ